MCTLIIVGGQTLSGGRGEISTAMPGPVPVLHINFWQSSPALVACCSLSEAVTYDQFQL